MPFPLKQTIMRGCTVAVVLATLTRVAVDAGVLTNILSGTALLRNFARAPKIPRMQQVMRKVGAVVKEQKVDPHIEHKIDVMLDLAPSPEDAVQDTGYNGTGISGNPRSKKSAAIQIKCGNCICKLFVMIDEYEAQMGCTQMVKKLLCFGPPTSCYMTEITKCLEKWANGKCADENRLFICL
ncbi:uncharacterized protein LOC142577947 [Dermacentor variabilis]|uniref:uncharacterized protein LOC142577947 n=1 Tax=Dermacentor variabilis TaxID=34621 RepID=UPI003F5CA463